jgi:hypothetical protein
MQKPVRVMIVPDVVGQKVFGELVTVVTALRGKYWLVKLDEELTVGPGKGLKYLALKEEHFECVGHH